MDLFNKNGDLYTANLWQFQWTIWQETAGFSEYTHLLERVGFSNKWVWGNNFVGTPDIQITGSLGALHRGFPPENCSSDRSERILVRPKGSSQPSYQGALLSSSHACE